MAFSSILRERIKIKVWREIPVICLKTCLMALMLISLLKFHPVNVKHVRGKRLFVCERTPIKRCY